MTLTESELKDIVIQWCKDFMDENHMGITALKFTPEGSGVKMELIVTLLEQVKEQVLVGPHFWAGILVQGMKRQDHG